LAELEELTLQPVSEAQLSLGASSRSQQESYRWLHQIQWQNQPLPLAAGNHLIPPSVVSKQLAAEFAQRLQQPDFLSYQTLQPALNNLAIAYVHEALIALGWSTTPGEKFTTAQLTETLGVIPQYHRLFEQCLRMLADVGALDELRSESATESQWQSTWQLAQNKPLLDAQQLYQQLHQTPLISAELTLLSRCGQQLAAVLRGQQNALSLLFPDGDLTDLTQLYQASVGPQIMNQLVQKAIIATAKKSSRPLKILEIGAGTGSTTAQLLPQLANLSQPVSYLFTDLSSVYQRCKTAILSFLFCRLRAARYREIYI